jgi:hypothetical protein
VFQFNEDVAGFPPVTTVDLTTPGCTTTAAFTPPSKLVLVTITDINGNIMPAGTTVTFTTTNGTIVSAPANFVVPNSTACLEDSGPGYFSLPFPGTVVPGFVCPGTSSVPLGSAPLTYSVLVKSDQTQTPPAPPATAYTCSNPTPSGVLTVTVTTPRGVSTSVQIPVDD